MGPHEAQGVTMKAIRLLLVLATVLSAALARGEDGRRTISIFVENTSSFPNRVQVRDVEGRYGLPEDCRIAKKVAARCDRDGFRESRPLSRDGKMTCAVALALLDEPRCQIRDLIYDDWIDGGMKVELQIHVSHEGYGMVAVRAVNNTDSWTFKPGLRDGDTVSHQ